MKTFFIVCLILQICIAIWVIAAIVINVKDRFYDIAALNVFLFFICIGFCILNLYQIAELERKSKPNEVETTSVQIDTVIRENRDTVCLIKYIEYGH